MEYFNPEILLHSIIGSRQKMRDKLQICVFVVLLLFLLLGEGFSQTSGQVYNPVTALEESMNPNGDGSTIDANATFSFSDYSTELNFAALHYVKRNPLDFRITAATSSSPSSDLEGSASNIVEIDDDKYTDDDSFITIINADSVSPCAADSPSENTIYGKVFDDEDVSGTLNGSEVGEGGVDVNLYEDFDLDGTPDGVAIQTTTTNGSGDYQFSIVTTESYTQRINSEDDDVRQKDGNGHVENDKDLKITKTGSGGNDDDRWSGFRFENVVIPEDAVVTSAYIRFTARDDKTGNAGVDIWGENHSNPDTFITGNGSYNVSGRVKTNESVNWQTDNATNPLTDWTNNTTYDTPDLSAIINEIIEDHSGLTNALVFIVKATDYGGSERKAYDYGSDPSKAPELHIEWTVSNSVKYLVDVEIPIGTTLTTPVYQEAIFTVAGLGDCDNDFGINIPRVPIANDDTPNNILENSGLNSIEVLTNDSFGGDGPNTGTIDVTSISSSIGIAAVNNGGTPSDPTDDTIDFTPAVNYRGPVSISYSIIDSNGDSDSATASFSVVCAADSPSENTIYGKVFEDEDSSGTMNGSEAGESGIDVNLYEDFDLDGSPDDVAIQTTTTDGNGDYQFDITSSGGSYTQRTLSDDDDAREKNDGKVETDKDFKPTKDGDDSLGALRFTNVSIPAGATITSAYVTFTADGDKSNNDASVIFYGQDDTANPATFTHGDTSSTNRISTRSRSNNSVSWLNLPAWVGDTTYQSPDLSEIVSEILVDVGGSITNGAIVIITESTGGGEERKAFDYGKNSAKAPQLHIEWTVSNSLKYLVDVDLPTGTTLTTSTYQEAVFTEVGLGDCDNDFGFTTPAVPTPADAPFTICEDETSTDLTTQDSTVLDGEIGTVSWYDGDPSTGTLISSPTTTNLNTISDLWAEVTLTVGGLSASVDITVTINSKPSDIITTETICSGETYTWNGTDYTTNQTGTRITNDGCTADLVLNLTVTPKPSDIVTTETICSGETYTWNGTDYTTNQTGTRISNDGCTADLVLNLTVTPKPADIVTTETICSGETYTWNGTDYTTNQTGTRISNDGCTADLVLNLTVTPKPADIVTTETICSGETYTWNGTDYTTNQTGTRISNDGCTADLVLNLTVTPKPADIVTDITIDWGATYTWPVNNLEYSTPQNGIRISSDGCTADQVLNLKIRDRNGLMANDDFFTTAEGEKLVTGNVLLNDSNFEGITITSFAHVSSQGGVIVYNDDGTFDYTPKHGFIGEDSFSYTICDSVLLDNCATSKVSILVEERSILLVDDTVSVDFGTTGSLNILKNDSFSESTPVVLNRVGGNARGTFLYDPETGEMNYTPDFTEAGSDVTVEYEICYVNAIGNSKCSTAILTISVSAVIDLELLITVDDTRPIVEKEVVFSIELSNNGPNDATGVEVLDLIPSGYKFEDFTASRGTYSELTGIWSIGLLEKDAIEILHINATVLPNGEWDNKAEVSSANEVDIDSTPNNSDASEDDFASVYTIPEVLVVIPEEFSPNGDGINDTFKIPYLEDLYPDFSMEIRNRWGNLVYKYKHSLGNGQSPEWWNGSSNGKWNLKNSVLPVGTYFYVIRLNKEGREPITGWIYMRK